MAGARILIADDDAAILDSVGWLLRESGYDVATVPGGVGLFDVLEQRPPDVLLLDVLMPDIDGYQLLERIRTDDRWRDLPVLMLSSMPPEEASVRALGLGANDFIRKPFRPKELLARVQAHLRQGAIVRQTRQALQRTEAALVRAEADAETRRKLVDILHEVTGDLSVNEVYHLLVRRVARALGVSHCSIVQGQPGGRIGVVVTSFENPGLHNLEIQLDRYPELRAALETGQPVLVEDLHTHALYAEVRRVWDLEGIEVPVRSVIALPFTIERGHYGVFMLRRTRDMPSLGPTDLEFAQAVITAAVAVIQRAQAVELTRADNVRLEHLAHTDPLTQLLNRRAMTERLTDEMERALRFDSSLALLMVDLDHFKRINDTFGHLVGDDVLREVSQLIRATVRASDVVARYGGEEFIVLLPDTPHDIAASMAERIRERVAEHSFGAHDGLALTSSVGLASFPAARIESVEDLFVRADAALYRAKADGRNCVRM
ncbi:MAG: diguanylate cyclase [Gemmatimonadaceae bacterium]|jgi:two-component system cell cycle response regulator|nr:diguanylate cyclase [Gemmatimonadaceae bacterium]